MNLWRATLTVIVLIIASPSIANKPAPYNGFPCYYEYVKVNNAMEHHGIGFATYKDGEYWFERDRERIDLYQSSEEGK